MGEILTPQDVADREMPPQMPKESEAAPQELSQGAKELNATKWMSEIPQEVSKAGLAKLRQDIRASGSWGDYVSKVSKERAVGPAERLIGKNVGEPMFTTGEFVAGKNGPIEILDPQPDASGKIGVREGTLVGNGLQWTEKKVTEAELFGEENKPN